jgi:hypothetical protein
VLASRQRRSPKPKVTAASPVWCAKPKPRKRGASETPCSERRSSWNRTGRRRTSPSPPVQHRLRLASGPVRLPSATRGSLGWTARRRSQLPVASHALMPARLEASVQMRSSRLNHSRHLISRTATENRSTRRLRPIPRRRGARAPTVHPRPCRAPTPFHPEARAAAAARRPMVRAARHPGTRRPGSVRCWGRLVGDTAANLDAPSVRTAHRPWVSRASQSHGGLRRLTSTARPIRSVPAPRTSVITWWTG